MNIAEVNVSGIVVLWFGLTIEIAIVGVYVICLLEDIRDLLKGKEVK